MNFLKIKKELLSLTKRKKYKHGEKYDLDDYDGWNDLKYCSSYISTGRTLGYVEIRNNRRVSLRKSNQRIVNKFKFGPTKYKLEIIIDSDFAICIDHKNVYVYGKPNNNINFLGNDSSNLLFSSYTIDKESFFNLSLVHNFVLNENEIQELRDIMNISFKNLSVTVYTTPVIIAGLVPWKW